MAGSFVLWVEGKDDQHVILSLMKHHQVPEVFRIIDREGIANLLEALRVQLTVGTGVARLGIVVDADTDAAARWAAIRDILVRSGYTPVPDHPSPEGTVIRHADLPVFGAWLMPENAAAGMLEDFIAALVPEEDFLWRRAAEVVDQIPGEHRRFSGVHRSKAHVHTWLAWQEEPGSPMGLAITKRFLDAEAPQAQRFVSWVRRLMLDEASETVEVSG